VRLVGTVVSAVASSSEEVWVVVSENSHIFQVSTFAIVSLIQRLTSG